MTTMDNITYNLMTSEDGIRFTSCLMKMRAMEYDQQHNLLILIVIAMLRTDINLI